MPVSPVSQQNPRGREGGQAGPGPGNVTQGGWRICLQDQCCKESTAEPRRRKTFTEAPGRGKTRRKHLVAGPRGLRHEITGRASGSGAGLWGNNGPHTLLVRTQIVITT